MLSNAYSQFSPALTNNSQLRQPRALVMINGYSVLWVNITITTTTFYVADSYHIEIPLYGQPNGFNASYLALQASLAIKIYVGFPINPDAFSSEDLDLLLVGDCDEMVIDPLRAVITFAGRDLTSRFIDTKTYAKYPNQTASTIVTNLAMQHGLTPIVTPTQGNVGTFYVRQNTLMTKETTEWDLITFLAQQSNYVVYVQADKNAPETNSNLVFAPKPTAENSAPYILQFQPPNAISASPIFNGMTLDMTRCFTVAKDVTVKVRVPYSPMTGRSFTATAGKKNPTINSTSAGNQIYTYTFPGLSNAQALAKAQQLLQQITLNELKVSCTIPGDNKLLKSSIIQLLGTQTRFDQIYYTDTVIRNISVEDGYTMDVHCKNMDTNSQVTL